MKKILKKLIELNLNNEQIGELMRMCYEYDKTKQIPETENKRLKAFFVLNIQKDIL